MCAACPCTQTAPRATSPCVPAPPSAFQRRGGLPSPPLYPPTPRAPPRPAPQLEDFEIYAFERLKVLRGIEQARSRGAKPEELDLEALKLAKENGLENLGAVDTFRKDNVSHHILRA